MNYFLEKGIYTYGMPNQRAPGQKLIAVPMDEKFIEYIDGALSQLRYPERSSFIRAAICEKLDREGFAVPGGLASAPYRAGKIKRYPPSRQHRAIFNEASSKKASLSTVVLKKGVVGALNVSPEQKPSPSTDAPSGKASPLKSGNAPHPKSRHVPPTQTPTAPKGGKV